MRFKKFIGNNSNVFSSIFYSIYKFFNKFMKIGKVLHTKKSNSVKRENNRRGKERERKMPIIYFWILLIVTVYKHYKYDTCQLLILMEYI